MISGLFSSTLASAQSQERSPDGLYLSPNLCLLSKAEANCKIRIEARWQTPQKGNYCLVSSVQNEPLQCWENKSEARFTISLKIEKSVVISLIDAADKTLVFKQPVRLQRQVTRFRKKRRNPWQFY